MIYFTFPIWGLILYNIIIGLLCFFIGFFSHSKNNFKKLVIVNMSIFFICIFLITIILFFVGSFLDLKDHEWCDYDSCSQEIYKWDYNGSSCFDSNNPDCREFLMLWNACQEYKNKMGIC